MSNFTIISPITKLGFGTTNVLFPTLIRFYKICCVFGIAVKWFVNVTNFVRISLPQQSSAVFSFIHAVYYIKNNYITDTYKQKFDKLSFTNHLL